MDLLRCSPFWYGFKLESAPVHGLPLLCEKLWGVTSGVSRTSRCSMHRFFVRVRGASIPTQTFS